MKPLVIFLTVFGIYLGVFAQVDEAVQAESGNQQSFNDSENEKQQQQGPDRGTVKLNKEQTRHDIIRNMKRQDRLAYLNAERMALRADLLKRYSFFQQESKANGYVRSIREGEDEEGNLCRHFETDLILNLSRHYFQAAVCEIEGQWVQVPISRVHFSDSSRELAPKPGLPGRGKGGWLPPLR